ncbi:MAG: hypothetical protein QF415_12230 [Candidatus Undinarchaeales archaeon]|jgi:hypothetical protein|nr:hypothetical protein [Candidatus Undinarchaeales archaeon]MDP7493139.1 hypothetical protein [Candidatus Undinarchaeales archaeon]
MPETGGEDVDRWLVRAARESTFHDWGRWYWRVLAMPLGLFILFAVLKGLGILVFVALAVREYRGKVRVTRGYTLIGLDDQGVAWRASPSNVEELRTLPILRTVPYESVTSATVSPKGDRDVELVLGTAEGEMRIALREDELELALRMLETVQERRGADLSYSTERTATRLATYNEAVKSGRISPRVEAVSSKDLLRHVSREWVRFVDTGPLAVNLIGTIVLFFLTLPALVTNPVVGLLVLLATWRMVHRLIPRTALWKVVITNKGIYVGEERSRAIIERLPVVSLVLAIFRMRIFRPTIVAYERLPLFYVRRTEVQNGIARHNLVLTTETEEVHTYPLRAPGPGLADVLTSILTAKDEREREKREYARNLSQHLMDEGWHESVASYVDDERFAALVRERGALSTEETSCMLIELGSLVSYLGMGKASDAEREELFRATLPPVRRFLGEFAQRHGFTANPWGVFNSQDLASAKNLLGRTVSCEGKRLGKVINVVMDREGAFSFYVIDDRTELVLDVLLKFDIITDFLIRKVRAEFFVEPADVLGITETEVTVSRATPIDRTDRTMRARWSFIGPSFLENYSIIPGFLLKYLRKNRFVARSVISQPFISPRYLNERIVTFDATFIGLVRDLHLDLSNGRVAAMEIRDRKKRAVLIPPCLNLARPHLYVGHGMGFAYEPC